MSFGLTPQHADKSYVHLTTKQESTESLTSEMINYHTLNPAIIPGTNNDISAYLFVYQANAQSVPNGVSTPIGLDTVLSNIGGFTFGAHGGISDALITFPMDGVYNISYSVPFESGDGNRYCYLTWSQSTLSLAGATSPGLFGFAVSPCGSCTIAASKGDTVFLSTYQTASGALHLLVGSQCPQLQIVRLGNLAAV